VRCIRTVVATVKINPVGGGLPRQLVLVPSSESPQRLCPLSSPFSCPYRCPLVAIVHLAHVPSSFLSPSSYPLVVFVYNFSARCCDCPPPRLVAPCDHFLHLPRCPRCLITEKRLTLVSNPSALPSFALESGKIQITVTEAGSVLMYVDVLVYSG